jgi:DNA/RNA endonuclease G (NUC1)
MLERIFPKLDQLFPWSTARMLRRRPVLLFYDRNVWRPVRRSLMGLVVPHDLAMATTCEAIYCREPDDDKPSLEPAWWSLGVVLAVIAALLLATRTSGGAARGVSGVTCEMVGHPTAVVDGTFREAYRAGPICFELDGKTRNAAWVMAIITPEMIAAKASRVDRFFADERVPQAWRVTPDHYTHSGKDRGHLLAQGHFAGNAAERDASCNMVNITPQDANLNQHFWRDQIEERAIRTPIREQGRTAVVCVFPLVAKAVDHQLTVQTIGPNDVWVPDRYALTVVFFEKTGGKWKPVDKGAWIVPNRPIPDDKTLADYRVPIRQVEAESGFDCYWALDDKVEEALEAQ